MDVTVCLLEAGADPDAPDEDGCTPLRAAVAADNAALVSALLRFGAAVDPVTRGKASPHIATLFPT